MAILAQQFHGSGILSVDTSAVVSEGFSRGMGKTERFGCSLRKTPFPAVLHEGGGCLR